MGRMGWTRALLCAVPMALVSSQAGFVPSVVAPMLLVIAGLLSRRRGAVVANRAAIALFALQLWLMAAASLTPDARTAFTVLAAWSLMAVGAILVADRHGSAWVHRHLALGCVPVIPFLLGGWGWWQNTTRWSPWDINPNQAAMNIAACGALFALQARGHRIWYPLVASAALMVLLTGSRGSLLVLAVACVPLFLQKLRHLVVFVSALVPAAIFFTSNAELPLFQRNYDSRLRIASDFSSRLTLFGLYGDDSQDWRVAAFSSANDSRIGTHAHNGFLWIGYLGGLVAMIGLVLLLVVLIRRSDRSQRWLLLAALASSLFGVFPFWPAYLFVLVVPTMITDLRTRPQPVRPRQSIRGSGPLRGSTISS